MLYVKKSTIPKAGKGLFVAKDLKKGEIITEYEGERLTWKQCQERNENKKGKEKGAYYFHINDKNCIDAENPKKFEDITAGDYLYERLVDLGLIKK